MNIKNYSFNAKFSYSDLQVDDIFLESLFKVLEKDNFFNQELNEFLKAKFSNRFEVYFFELCRKMLQLKREIFCGADTKDINLLKNRIFKFLEEINNLIANNIFIIDSDEFFVFKPIILLKFWDNTTQDMDVSTYNDIVKLFVLKTLIKKKRDARTLINAFNEVKSVFSNENIFDKARIFLYYYGKITTLFIKNYDELKNTEIFKIYINKENPDNFKKILKIINSYIIPNSSNYKKRYKHYSNLAKIAVFFNINQEK